MTRTRLVLLPAAVGDPAPFQTFEGGRPIARGSLRLGDPPPTDPARTVAVVPGTEVGLHRVALPGRTPKQRLAAAAVLLEDRLAARGDAHLALGETGLDGLTDVYATDRSRMTRWLDQAEALGLRLDALAPDYALLPMPDGDETCAVSVGDRVAFRGRERAGAAEPELAALLLADVAAPLEGEARDRLFARGLEAGPVDLRQGDFDPRRAEAPTWASWRLPAGLAAALVLSPAVLWGAEIVRHRSAEAELDRRAEAVARETAPNGRADRPPEDRVRARLAELGRGRSFSPAAAALFTAVERTEGAELVSLLYGEDGALRATVAHPNYADVEAMRAVAAEAGFVLREDATVTEGGRVLTDVVLEGRS